MAKRSEPEPIVTRIKERRTVEINGKSVVVDETVIFDFGKGGKTTVYIQPPQGMMNKAMLNSMLAQKGLQLVEPCPYTLEDGI